MKHKVANIFPTRIYISEYEEDITNELEYINNLEYRSKDHKLITSLSVNNYLLNVPELQNIKEYCQKHINHFFNEILEFEDELLITQSWIARNSRGTRHAFHKHTNSILSGSFYFKVQEDTPLIFDGKNVNKITDGIGLVHKSGVPTDHPVGVPVKDKSLLLFPSMIDHGVPFNEHEEDRICLAFNTFPKTLGKKELLNFVEVNHD